MNNKTIIKVFEFDIIKQDRVYDGFKFEKNYLEAIQKFNTKNVIVQVYNNSDELKLLFYCQIQSLYFHIDNFL